MSNYDGNSYAWAKDNEREGTDHEPCKFCDCKGTHACINCDKEITWADCVNNDGYCDHCAFDLNKKQLSPEIKTALAQNKFLEDFLKKTFSL